MAYYAVQGHGTNPYFRNWDASNEQGILESLIIESIKIYGMNMYYMPRNPTNTDPLYTESDQATFTKANPIELYIKDVNGFDGSGTFLSTFGLQIQDQVTLTVAKRTFLTEIGHGDEQVRPNEGDVIYFPLNGMMFQILYVDFKPFFYQLGTLQTYDLICGTYQYAGETFDTGFDFIDNIQKKYSLNALDYAMVDEEGDFLETEDGNFLVSESYLLSSIIPGVENDFIDQALQDGNKGIIDDDDAGGESVSDDNQFGNNAIMDWSEFDPFSEGQR